MTNKDKRQSSGPMENLAADGIGELDLIPEDQALSWIARLRAADVSRRDQQRFSVWLSASEQNKLAFDQALDLWDDLAVVAQLPFAELDSPNSTKPDVSIPTLNVALLRFNFVPWRIALPGMAALALTVAVSWNLMTAPLEYTTEVGEQRTIALEDGSLLHLNTATSVSVNMRENLRSITLNYGEAFFDVAPDQERPFEVNACQVTARALGTAFNVRCDDIVDGQITVSEGVVRVSVENAANGRVEEELVESEQLSYLGAEGFSAKTTINSEDVTAWKRQLLIYNGVSLVDMIRDLNRYSEQQITISDPSIEDISIGIRFSLKDRMVALKGLETSFPIKVVEHSPQHLELVPTL